MNRVIKILLIILATLTLASITIPFFIFCEIKDALEIVGSLTGAIASIAAVIIAFLFYEKFGVSRKMIERQSETVFNLLESLKKTRIKGEFQSGFLQIFIQEDLTIYKSKSLAELKDRKIAIFPNDYATGFEKISQYSESIWIPKEIKNRIYPLMFLTAKSIKDLPKVENELVKIYFTKTPIKDVTAEDLWYSMNDGDLTFGKYINLLEELVKETKNWIDKHSDFDVPLNI